MPYVVYSHRYVRRRGLEVLDTIVQEKQLGNLPRSGTVSHTWRSLACSVSASAAPGCAPAISARLFRTCQARSRFSTNSAAPSAAEKLRLRPVIRP